MIILNHLHQYIGVLFLMPLGVLIGALTERIASRNVGITPSKLWNTAVKLTVASLLWTHFICPHPHSVDDKTENRQCVLPSSIPFLYYNESIQLDRFNKCSVVEGIELVITIVIKCTILYIATRFGESLQPVGLTGGIACGKSTVSKLLRDTSSSTQKDAFAIIDVDEIAHDILVPGKMKRDCAYQRILSTFKGDDILQKENKETADKRIDDPLPIDRRKLGDIIFRDITKRKKLNAITHPLISKVMLKQIIREHFSPTSDLTSIVAVDIPLLFEVGFKMKLLFAVKIVVACTPELQLQRLIARNPDLTEEQCKKRIESQIPVKRKIEMADIIVWNNGTMDDLIRQVGIAREEVISRKHGLMGITLPSLISFACLLTTLACINDIIRL